MDEIFGRHDMISSAKLKQLSVKTDLRGFVQLGSHLGALALSGIVLILTWGTLWAVPAFIVYGIVMNFTYAAQHELSHWTVFRTRGLNEFFGRVFGFIQFYPRDYDQVQHFAHHRFTQDWERDGELGRARFTLATYLLWLLGPAYWYLRLRRILRFSLGIVTEQCVPVGRKAALIREARWHLAGYGLIAALSVVIRSSLALQLWLLPLLALKAVQQLQNTIEHLGMPHAAGVTQNTRSTRTNALMRWIGWNIQYHTAHHAFPGVPFYNLPALHHEIFVARNSRPPTMSYLGFQWAALRAFSNGSTEADYSDDAMWIGDGTDLAPLAARSRPRGGDVTGLD